MLFKLFIFWLVSLPLINWQGVFEGAKIVWFLGGGFFLTLYWFSNSQKLFQSLQKSDLFYFFWLLILLFSSLFGVHPQESILGGSLRHQGVIFFFLLWLVMKIVSSFNQKQKKVFLKALTGVVVFESILIFYQTLTGIDLYFQRPMGTFGEPNAAAGFLALALFFVPATVGYLTIPAIIFSGSKTALIMVILFLGSKVLGNWLGAISFFRPVSIFENRPLFWRLGWKQFLKRPWFGFGAESGEVVFNQAFKEAEMPLEDLIVDRSHNLFLDLALWSGMVGLVSFVLWLFSQWKQSNRFALLAWLVYASFQPVGVVHWLMLAIITELL